MRNEHILDKNLKQLGKVLTPDPSFNATLMERIHSASAKPNLNSILDKSPHSYFKYGRLILAACVLVFIFSWISTSSNQSRLVEQNWWLGSSSVYAQEISQNLEQARVDGLSFRNTTTFVMEDGTRSTSSTVNTYFMQHDRYRLDIYDAGKIREIQWYVPIGNELVQTGLRIQSNESHISRHKKGDHNSSPISQILGKVKYLDQATHRFNPKEIEGKQCIGFEIDISKLEGDLSKGKHEIWFDTKTKLPVQIISDRPFQKNKNKIKRWISTMDQFEWNPRFPANTFVPQTNSAMKLDDKN